MKTTNQLDHLRIASPCPASWEKMRGDDRVRCCDLCNLKVYDISRLSRSEAESLITNTGGRICARLYRRADGTIITKDCPIGLGAIRRRAAKVAAAAFATVLSVCSLVLGQKPSKKDSCQPQITISRSLPKSPDQVTTISGTIFDANGAVVARAKITAADEFTNQTRQATAKDDGTFQMSGLPAGTYDLQIESPGFAKTVIKKLYVDERETVNLDVILLVDPHGVTMGILISTETELLNRDDASIKTVFSGQTIRNLPIH